MILFVFDSPLHNTCTSRTQKVERQIVETFDLFRRIMQVVFKSLSILIFLRSCALSVTFLWTHILADREIGQNPGRKFDTIRKTEIQGIKVIDLQTGSRSPSHDLVHFQFGKNMKSSRRKTVVYSTFVKKCINSSDVKRKLHELKMICISIFCCVLTQQQYHFRSKEYFLRFMFGRLLFSLSFT